MKRKICIFSGESRAAKYGIGTYIEQLIECLKESNLDFVLIYMHAHTCEYNIEEKENYKIISIPRINSNRLLHRKYYSRNISYLLRELLPERDVDYVFHLNFMSDPYLVSCLKRKFKCKIILVSHYTNWSFSLLGDEKRIEEIKLKKKSRLGSNEKVIIREVKEDKKMMERCDQVIFVAQHTHNSYVRITNVNLKNSLLINNALKDIHITLSEVDKERIKKKYFFSVNDKLIMFAGRLDKVKGVSFLIEAFKKLLETNPECHLIIAGEGDFNTLLSDSTDYWRKITFTGKINKEKLYEFYNISDLGIVCSTHEEFGFVAIEMMMNKLPIIVSDIGGLAEIVEDNVSGLKVPIRDSENCRGIDPVMLSEKIKYLFDNPDITHQLGANGRKRFLERYEIKLFQKKILHLYNNI